ncbi:nitroreductase [Pedobacter sp. CFBP9032]|uniref:nitroreductase family protein n=1 Tax=Pedobacter sp. CFBP9032 TaxID=3096539 RepID=UPI002A6A5B78|nr:nitroreductase [Pedobacter sp. CFBP9032]MDY0906510.1 nitroreductase [Pedobacter sp. CFBP9032]
MRKEINFTETELVRDSGVVTHYIQKRQSIYADQYLGGTIPEAELLEILTNATRAPTHKMTEPWRFVVLTDSQLLKYGRYMSSYYEHLYQDIPDAEKKLAKYSYLKDYPLKAACMVAIIFIKSRKINIPEWEELAAISCAVQNMAISATSFNIASYWATGGSAIDYVKTLGLAENEQSLGLFFMGYTDLSSMPVKKKRTPIDQKVTWRS